MNNRNVLLGQVQKLLVDGQYDQVLELFRTTLERCEREHAIVYALLNMINEAVCGIDRNGQVFIWNERSEALYGIKAEEILNRPIEQFFSNLMITGAMKNCQIVTERYHNPRPEKHVLINARPLMINGQVAGGIATERDITELVELNQKLSQSHQEVRSLKKTINRIHVQSDPFARIFGRGKAICDAVSVARRVAQTSVPVLLTGESGTGKELFARAIHESSQVAGPFIAINCGAIPANLFESELFGYEPGAFTGADRKGKAGLLEKANGGTLLLDEVGDMPKEMQIKLLRALQEKCIYRVGGSKLVPVDFRVLSATHRNLKEMIKQGTFREDLYYRLNVVAIYLPPLRERLEDLPELVHRGIQYYSVLYDKRITRVDPALMDQLMHYQWPGNIRELLNALERMVILAEGPTLYADDLPPGLSPPDGVERQGPLEAAGLQEATDRLERDAIVKALEEASYNKAAAAKRLGLPRSTLYYKMRKLGIECQ